MRYTVTICYRDGSFKSAEFTDWTVLEYIIQGLNPYRLAVRDIHVNCALNVKHLKALGA